MAALQCKWKTGDDVRRIGKDLRDAVRLVWGQDAEAVVATLYDKGDTTRPEEGIRHLSSTTLVELLLKHRRTLPTAHRLGIAEA